MNSLETFTVLMRIYKLICDKGSVVLSPEHIKPNPFMHQAEGYLLVFHGQKPCYIVCQWGMVVLPDFKTPVLLSDIQAAFVMQEVTADFGTGVAYEITAFEGEAVPQARLKTRQESLSYDDILTEWQQLLPAYRLQEYAR